MTINNLPRHLRFKQQNVILVGSMPGPGEPKDVNPYLGPLVEELKNLHTGVLISGKKVKAILSCIANDIPAARKICGFAVHSARLSCTRCKKIFPTEKFGDKPDYTRYRVDQWQARVDAEVKAVGVEYLQAKTKYEQKSIIYEHGSRYSALHEVPYFSVVFNTIIDPMHNLFLGTAKHTLQTW